MAETVALGAAISKTPMTCRCGNSIAHEGFYSCDSEGRSVRDAELVCCDRCGRITHAASGEYRGTRVLAVPADIDSQ